MTRPDQLVPYSQGELDGLCGIYAIINGIRLTLGNRTERFTAEDWRELFYVLLVAADELIGAPAATTCGIDAKPLKRILKSAARHMEEEHELRLIVSRPVKD